MSKACVNQDKCLGCGACTGVCPIGAITIGDNGKAHVDTEKCAGCGACTGICPVEAVKLK